MSAPLLSENRYLEDGLTWKEYLEQVPRSRNMQEKRYQELNGTMLNRFRSLRVPYRAVVLGMATCGDCAWAIPYMMKVFSIVPGLKARIFLREENPDLQDRLLTKGKKSVPKLALVDEDGQVVTEWGPRPRGIQGYVEASVGVLDRSEWYPKVVEYYRNSGLNDLIDEIHSLLMVVSEEDI